MNSLLRGSVQGLATRSSGAKRAATIWMSSRSLEAMLSVFTIPSGMGHELTTQTSRQTLHWEA
ncbi:unnamed protein product [Durusdinium trenchii]|uniref:Uncharacterized protein n=1 Tax=Durusdinium trenchii TaxID=1381693 RepID=A0ABP0LFP6_9DINO